MSVWPHRSRAYRWSIRDRSQKAYTIVSTHTDGEGARNLLYDAFRIAEFVLLLNEPVYEGNHELTRR